MLLFVLALTACWLKPKTLYEWGPYETVLYAHYKAPQDAAAFVAKLQPVITEAESSGKVPPGCYAEYGFALFEAGDKEGAVTYFNKERALWPESSALMEKLIRIAQPPKAPATAQEPSEKKAPASKPPSNKKQKSNKNTDATQHNQKGG